MESEAPSLIKRAWYIKTSATKSTHEAKGVMLAFIFDSGSGIETAMPRSYQIEQISSTEYRIFPGGTHGFVYMPGGSTRRVIRQTFHDGLEQSNIAGAEAILASNGEMYVRTRTRIVNGERETREQFVRRMMRGKWAALAGEPEPVPAKEEAKPEPLSLEDRMRAVLKEIAEISMEKGASPYRLKMLADGSLAWQAPTIR